jgi:hypothetical protein
MENVVVYLQTTLVAKKFSLFVPSWFYRLGQAEEEEEAGMPRRPSPQDAERSGACPPGGSRVQ